MWQANEAQQARIQALLQGFSEEIPPLWTDEHRQSLAGNWNWKEVVGRTEFCQPFMERLKARFGEAFLDQALVEFLTFPAENPLPKTCEEGCREAPAWRGWPSSSPANGWRSGAATMRLAWSANACAICWRMSRKTRCFATPR